MYTETNNRVPSNKKTSKLKRSQSYPNLSTVQENKASILRKKLLAEANGQSPSTGNSIDSRLRYSRHSMSEVSTSSSDTKSPASSYPHTRNSNPSTRNSNASTRISNYRNNNNNTSTYPAKSKNYPQSSQKNGKKYSADSRNTYNKSTSGASYSSYQSSASSSKSSALSSTSSSARAKNSEIILRKIFQDGKWYEEKEENYYTSAGKKQRISQAKINTKYTPEVTDTLSSVDPNFLDVDRASQTMPKNSRGIIQDDQEDFGKEILARINSYRMQHGARAIKLNRNLSVYAREWAKYLAMNAKVGFCHRHDIGEAIYVKTTSAAWVKISGDEIVDKWYSEIEHHDFDNHKDIPSPNFSQILWRATREIGVALERSMDGHISYIVLFFHPKGNFPGDLIKQVYKVGGQQRMIRNEKGLLEPQAAAQDESIVQAVARACNYYRLIHNVVTLVLDKSLSEYAQEWATQLAQEDRVRSRPNNIYGENIYRSTIKINSELSGLEPVEYWYSTKKYHTFKDPADIRAAPFTQLVWGDSRELGVGAAKSKSDRTYVVANFNPPGNLIGQFAKQVSPMKWH